MIVFEHQLLLRSYSKPLRRRNRYAFSEVVRNRSGMVATFFSSTIHWLQPTSFLFSAECMQNRHLQNKLKYLIVCRMECCTIRRITDLLHLNTFFVYTPFFVPLNHLYLVFHDLTVLIVTPYFSAIPLYIMPFR